MGENELFDVGALFVGDWGMVKRGLEVLVEALATLLCGAGTEQLGQADPVVGPVFLDETEEVGVFGGRPGPAPGLLDELGVCERNLDGGKEAGPFEGGGRRW